MSLGLTETLHWKEEKCEEKLCNAIGWQIVLRSVSRYLQLGRQVAKYRSQLDEYKMDFLALFAIFEEPRVIPCNVFYNRMCFQAEFINVHWNSTHELGFFLGEVGSQKLQNAFLKEVHSLSSQLEYNIQFKKKSWKEAPFELWETLVSKIDALMRVLALPCGVAAQLYELNGGIERP